MYCSKDVQPAFRVERLKMPLGRLCDPSCHIRLDVSGGFAWSGGEWSPDSAGRYVWSVLNGFANAPLYVAGKKDKSASSWRVLDGCQRVRALTDFVEGRLRLPVDAVSLHYPSACIAGMNIDELRESHPLVARRFDAFWVPMFAVYADGGVEGVVSAFEFYVEFRGEDGF